MNKTLLSPLLIQDFVYDVCGYELNYGDFFPFTRYPRYKITETNLIGVQNTRPTTHNIDMKQNIKITDGLKIELINPTLPREINTKMIRFSMALTSLTCNA